MSSSSLALKLGRFAGGIASRGGRSSTLPFYEAAKYANTFFDPCKFSKSSFFVRSFASSANSRGGTFLSNVDQKTAKAGGKSGAAAAGNSRFQSSAAVVSSVSDDEEDGEAVAAATAVVAEEEEKLSTEKDATYDSTYSHDKSGTPSPWAVFDAWGAGADIVAPLAPEMEALLTNDSVKIPRSESEREKMAGETEILQAYDQFLQRKSSVHLGTYYTISV